MNSLLRLVPAGAVVLTLLLAGQEAEARGGRGGHGGGHPHYGGSVRHSNAGYRSHDTRQDMRYHHVDNRQEIRHDTHSRGPDPAYNHVDNRQDRVQTSGPDPAAAANHERTADRNLWSRHVAAATSPGPGRDPGPDPVARRNPVVRHDIHTGAPIRDPGPDPVARRHALRTIPRDYRHVVVGGVPYYYGDDLYYVWDEASGMYVVVDPYADDDDETLAALPEGAVPAGVVNGRTLYKHEGAYYERVYRSNRVRYRRVEAAS